MNSYKCETFKSGKGGVKLFINGYSYNKNRQVQNKHYWLCELTKRENCKSRAITKLDGESDLHTVLNLDDCHNHDPNPNKLSIARIVESIKNDSAANYSTKTCKILQNAKRNHDEMVLADLPSTSALRQVAYREKQKGKPTFIEPKNIFFTVHHDNLQLKNQNFIMFDKFLNERKRIIIFSSLDLIKNLAKSNLWIMDGTFAVAGIFQQLYVIHGNVLENNAQTFPLVFALCTHRDKSTYNKLFELIIEYSGEQEFEINVSNVIMDFEMSAIQSVRQTFDNVTINGCFFHLGQIIYRRIQGAGKTVLYGTNRNFAIEMKCLLALAFLESNEITQYFQKLQEQSSPDAISIINKFGEDFVVGKGNNCSPRFPPSIWSIATLQSRGLPRTQNSAESWHHRFNQIIDKPSPGFYYMGNELLHESIKVLADIECLKNGNSPPKRKKIYEQQQHKIDNILKRKSEYSECEFLRAMASNLSLKKSS